MAQKVGQVGQGTENLTGICYVIDPARAEEQQRDLMALLQDRLCDKCADRSRRRKTPITVRRQIRDIYRCCASSEDFIDPNMPLKEIVFRLLLKGANKPKALWDLHYAVTEDWGLPTHPMNISMDVLKRILDTDYYYCFKEVAVEVKKRTGKKGNRKKK